MNKIISVRQKPYSLLLMFLTQEELNSLIKERAPARYKIEWGGPVYE